MLFLVVPALVVAGFLFWIIRSSRELFCLSVRRGQVLVMRGRISPSLKEAIEDVVRRARVARATIRAVKQRGAARLVVSGADEAVEQRLRNTFGIHPASRLRTAPPPSGRNLGQRLGWSWLAWTLARRVRERAGY